MKIFTLMQEIAGFDSGHLKIENHLCRLMFWHENPPYAKIHWKKHPKRSKHLRTLPFKRWMMHNRMTYVVHSSTRFRLVALVNSFSYCVFIHDLLCFQRICASEIFANDFVLDFDSSHRQINLINLNKFQSEERNSSTENLFNTLHTCQTWCNAQIDNRQDKRIDKHIKCILCIRLLFIRWSLFSFHFLISQIFKHMLSYSIHKINK